MRIDAILMDIGEVLVGLDYQPALLELRRLSGLSHEELVRRLEEHSRIEEYEAGRLTTREFFDAFCRLLEIQQTFEEFRAIWSSVFRFHEAGADTLVSPQLFRSLKRECRMVALSNTNELQFDYLSDRHPLIGEFHDYVLSFRAGCLKPEPEIYLLAVEKTGCRPSNILFIDDVPENVEAARRLGIQGVVFQGERELRRELSSLKLL